MTEAERLAFRPNEAARVMGVSRDLIFQWLRTGELRSIRIGAARLIPRQALEEFLAGREAEARDG